MVKNFIDYFLGWIETLLILRDKQLTKEILESMKDADEGRTFSWQEVVGRPQRN